MNGIITTKSTSLSSAVGRDIELRVTSNTKYIFRPEIVDNPHDKKACVRGNFIFQRKKTSGNWEDYKNYDLSKLKNSEWIKLELKAGELYKLLIELNNYYQIFEKYGIVLGETNFVVTPKNAKAIIEQFLRNPENFKKLLDLRIGDLKKLNIVSNINGLKSVLKTWEENKNNGEENFWQAFFKENSWVIAQVFSYTVILFKDKAYVGGKSIENKGGNIVDFIFKNGFSDNVLVIEIKTPVTSLMGNHYRDSSYGISIDLSGSIVQTLKYKDDLQKNYYALRQESNKSFQVFNPKCMLIIGTSISHKETTTKQKSSFELFRSDSKQVEIVTFDELFQKIQMLVDLLEQ